jgi:hypothetical protein
MASSTFDVSASLGSTIANGSRIRNVFTAEQFEWGEFRGEQCESKQFARNVFLRRLEQYEQQYRYR